MHIIGETVIDALGGTTAVARLIEAPITTVQSWKRIGIPASRLAHLKLAAKEAGLTDRLEAALARRSQARAA